MQRDHRRVRREHADRRSHDDDIEHELSGGDKFERERSGDDDRRRLADSNVILERRRGDKLNRDIADDVRTNELHGH